MSREVLIRILELARWAPSGDNQQPYRFEVLTDNHVAVHGYDTRQHVVYDFDGHASHMAHGALLETLRIAASKFGYATTWTIREDNQDEAPIYDVLLAAENIATDPLAEFIEARCVQRRPMQRTPLSAEQKQALIRSVGNGYTLQFFESATQRRAVAGLLWRNAKIRLTCPEAYPVHCEVIEWGTQFSKDKIPEGAVGVDAMTAKLMRWVMQSWDRVDFFNRYLFGTVAPRIQLDYLPAICCASHVLLKPAKKPDCLKDYVDAGVAMQRLWLTVSALGMYLQPEMTPVIFRWYTQHGRDISKLASINTAATELAQSFDALTGENAQRPFSFFCRVGYSSPPTSRSLRRDLADLMWQ